MGATKRRVRGGGVRVKDKNEECCAVLVRAGILVCMLSRK